LNNNTNGKKKGGVVPCNYRAGQAAKEVKDADPAAAPCSSNEVEVSALTTINTNTNKNKTNRKIQSTNF
jgi:hypothetical protein